MLATAQAAIRANPAKRRKKALRTDYFALVLGFLQNTFTFTWPNSWVLAVASGRGYQPWSAFSGP
jgi:hypothetical protein